jgi:hypothetical protein
MSTSITEYGETATENLTETGQNINGAITELGELIINGYVEPTLKQITDSLSLAENLLRYKPALLVADNINAADSTLNHKPLLPLVDSVSLADATSTPARVLHALDSIGIGDTALVSKLLVLTEEVSLVEIVERGIGGALKTRLFLILGDLAVQLTGN